MELQCQESLSICSEGKSLRYKTRSLPHHAPDCRLTQKDGVWFWDTKPDCINGGEAASVSTEQIVNIYTQIGATLISPKVIELTLFGG